MQLLRRLRGIAGTALTWACAWGLVGAAVYSVASGTWNLPPDAPRGGMILTGSLFLAAYGLLSGGAFALAVLVGERRRTLSRLTLPRVAAWGALGGAILGAAATATVGMTAGSGVLLLLGTLLSGGCAAGSLAVARRAESPRPIPGHAAGAALPRNGRA